MKVKNPESTLQGKHRLPPGNSFPRKGKVEYLSQKIAVERDKRRANIDQDMLITDFSLFNE